jgi:DNA polymerase theta
VPVGDVARRFNVDRGTLQSLQMQCATFAGQVARFCEIVGAGLLAATLNRFRKRLNFAARQELLGLMVLPSCSRDTARIFVNCGITSPIELADLKVEGIAAIICRGVSGGERVEATAGERELAKKILSDAVEYTDSLGRIEALEEDAMQNIS